MHTQQKVRIAAQPSFLTPRFFFVVLSSRISKRKFFLRSMKLNSLFSF